MEVQADLSKHSYCFTVPCYEGKLQVETALSLLRVSGKLTSMNIKHAFVMVRGGALIHSVRNELVERFLTETDCDTMVCIDADIEFSWDAFERLAVYSDLYPIVCGVYCGRGDPPKFTVNHLEKKLNEHGLLPINGTGFGFVALQRKVFDILQPETYKVTGKPDRRAFFKCVVDNNEEIGEDIYFFRQAQKAGITAYADPGIELKHHGTKVFDFQFKDAIHQLLGE